ncbi:hypothetical protein [Haematobacter missouriensis]|nr:hypothetical protein [Haematobacter missouriensis]
MDQPSEGGMTRPTWKNEINITAILALLMFAITVGGVVLQHGRFTQRVEQWIASHEDLHKQRLADLTASSARLDERIKSVEAESRSIDNLRYRMTVQEQERAADSKAQEDTRKELSQLTSDIRLIREILTRLDPGPQRKP